MPLIKQQWGSTIRSNNPIKKSHIEATLSNMSLDLFDNEVYVKYELHENGDEKAVTIYGYGNRKNDNVKAFSREFRKYLRLHGHVLDGNIWLYGEKEIETDAKTIKEINPENKK
jgi:hypothetical protein